MKLYENLLDDLPKAMKILDKPYSLEPDLINEKYKETQYN